MATSQGIWTDTTVGGHACQIYEPSAASPHRYVVIYLHGLHGGRLSDHAAFCDLFDRHGLKVICPITARSWWTDRICAEFDSSISAERYVLDRVVAFVAQHWGATPPRIALLGTSMGGQGALRLAYKHPNTFPIVAALSPAIDYHLRMEAGDESLWQMYADPGAARQDTAILHVHPLNWPRHQFFACDPTDVRWWDSCDRLRMKLGSLGIPFECDLETIAGGHGFEYYDHMAERAVNFLVSRLDQERRRVAGEPPASGPNNVQ